MADVLTCLLCGATAKRPARGLPRGWHRIADDHYCGVCWAKKYSIRAVTMPVASPLDCSWQELNIILRKMWGATTACSNWMMTELRCRDCHRTSELTKMPPMPRVVLYADARRMFPSLPATSVVSLEQACQRRYRKSRMELIWRGNISLPSFRYPTPFPVHNQSWHTEVDEANRPIVSVRADDQRLRLRLSGHATMRYQRKAFDLIHTGKSPQGELAIYRKSEARTGDPNGKEDARHTTVMVKMVAWFEREERAAGEKQFVIRSTPESLLVGTWPNGETWKYNADHLKRWSLEHRRIIQRFAEDHKFENRPVPDWSAQRVIAVRKYRDRMNVAAWCIAADLAGYARRRGIGAVNLDLSDHSFCSRLPWYMFEQKITQELEAIGIQCTIASAEAEGETSEPLAEEEVS